MKKIIPEGSVLIPEQAELAFKGQIFNVYQWQQELFDGSIETFEMLRRPDTVVAMCIVDDKLLVLQDEQPHRGIRRNFPGGRVDPTDESIEAAATREVHEETGYSFKNWRLIKVVQPQMKIEWFVYILLAWEVTGQDEPHADPGEKIVVEALALEEVKQLITDKVVYMPDSSEFIGEANDVNDLLNLPEFTGPSVQR